MKATRVEPGRDYTVKVTKPATGESVVVRVVASSDGMASTRAMIVQRQIRFSGELMEAYEVMADGTDRRLLLNC